MISVSLSQQTCVWAIYSQILSQVFERLLQLWGIARQYKANWVYWEINSTAESTFALESSDILPTKLILQDSIPNELPKPIKHKQEASVIRTDYFQLISCLHKLHGIEKRKNTLKGGHLCCCCFSLRSHFVGFSILWMHCYAQNSIKSMVHYSYKVLFHALSFSRIKWVLIGLSDLPKAHN